MAKTTEVILRSEVEHLGHPGEIVHVAPGYARNYLLPQGLAYAATEANKHRVEQEKKKYTERLQEEKVRAESLAQELADLELSFQEMAGEEDQLYGSVSIADIAERLESLGFDVARQQIKLDQPIKAIGDYEVPLRLHPEVMVPIRVRVEREPV